VLIAGAYVSFTEVGGGGHEAYNRWHLFDHLPEQYRLAGVASGARWVLTPDARRRAVTRPPFDRVHYVTLYLLAAPLDETITQFRALGAELRDLGRFDTHRTSHLAGPLRVTARSTAAGNPLDPAGVPFAPHRSVRVVLDGTGGRDDVPGAVGDGLVGRWTFDGIERLAGRTLAVSWHEPTAGDVTATVDDRAAFDARLDVIDPFARHDWFDAE
jgi:hypothetical protein